MEIHRSARKHGIADEDTIHALQHALIAVELDPGSEPPRMLIIGPDRAGNPLEIIVLALAEDDELVIHAMPLRRHFHDLLP